MSGFDVLHPAVLLLVLLAGLPWWPRRRDALAYASFIDLPVDALGRTLDLAWRGLASTALASLAIGLAGPGRSGGETIHVGRGADIVLLLDRSSSMDEIVSMRTTAGGRLLSEGDSKNKVVRDLLTRFVAERAGDRFSLMMFSRRPMLTVPFTERTAVVQAGLAAAGVGRGLPNTDLGAGVLAAAGEFEGRAYAGSRVVVVVSDGGAQLDAATRDAIRATLAAHKIALYWIYIRSGANSPDLNAATAESSGEADITSTEERSLHNFFLGLATPYRLFQTDDAAALERALAEIARQQNQPLSYPIRLPRDDYTARFFAVALTAVLVLWGLWSAQVRRFG